MSVSTVTVALDALGLGLIVGYDENEGRRYVNWVALKTFWTVVETLYGWVTPDPETPLILIGVPEFKLWSVAVVTVTIAEAVDPFPEIILVIVIGSVAKAPTISHSGFLLQIQEDLLDIFVRFLDMHYKHLKPYYNTYQGLWDHMIQYCLHHHKTQNRLVCGEKNWE